MAEPDAGKPTARESSAGAGRQEMAKGLDDLDRSARLWRRSPCNATPEDRKELAGFAKSQGYEPTGGVINSIGVSFAQGPALGCWIDKVELFIPQAATQPGPFARSGPSSS